MQILDRHLGQHNNLYEASKWVTNSHIPEPYMSIKLLVGEGGGGGGNILQISIRLPIVHVH